MKIPNELSCCFDTVDGRKEIVQQYANSNTMFTGKNSDGENVYLSN